MLEHATIKFYIRARGGVFGINYRYALDTGTRAGYLAQLRLDAHTVKQRMDEQRMTRRELSAARSQFKSLHERINAVLDNKYGEWQRIPCDKMPVRILGVQRQSNLFSSEYLSD